MSEEFTGRIVLSAGKAANVASKATTSFNGEPLWATDTGTLYVCQDGKAIEVGGGGAGTVTVGANGGLSGDGSPETPLVVNIPALDVATPVSVTNDLLLLAVYDSKTETYTNKAANPVRILTGINGDVTVGIDTKAAVVGLQSVPVSESTPANGQVLTFNSGQWSPANLPASPPPPPAADVGNIPGPLRIKSFETVYFVSNQTIGIGSTTTHLDLYNTSGSTKQVLGFLGGEEGRVLYVTVIGYPITLRKNSSSASVGNRIDGIGAGSDIDMVTLGFGETATFVYHGSAGSGYWRYSANSPLSVPIERVSNRGALASLNSVPSNLLNLTTDTATGSYSVASGTFTATGVAFSSLPAGTYLLLVEADVGIGISAGPDAEIQCEIWNSTAGSAIATRSMNKGFSTAAVAGRHSFFVLFTLSATSTVQLRARRLSSGSPTWSFSNLSGIVMTYIRIG